MVLRGQRAEESSVAQFQAEVRDAAAQRFHRGDDDFQIRPASGRSQKLNSGLGRLIVAAGEPRIAAVNLLIVI